MNIKGFNELSPRQQNLLIRTNENHKKGVGKIYKEGFTPVCVESLGKNLKVSVKINSTMYYEEFYKTYFEPDYKRSVAQSTFENRVSSMRLHFSYFYKKKLKDINAPMLKKWQNHLSEKYSNGYIRATYGLFQKSLDLAVTLGLLRTNVAKQVGNVRKEKSRILDT